MRLADIFANRTTRLRTGTTNIDYLYDASGNMTRESGNRNLEYDYRQRTRLYFITNNTTLYEQYTYGADGHVVKRLNRSSGLIYSYVYIDGLFQYSDQIGHASNAQNHINILDQSGAIISQHRQGTFAGEVAYNNGELYMINNHVGSVIGTYDLNGTQQEGEDYYPFGDSSHHWNGNKQQRFAGKIRSSWTGYYDFGARQYIPWLAKFTSVDPLAAKSTDRNPYHYASNNPINRVDPSGMKDEPSGKGVGDDKKNIVKPNQLNGVQVAQDNTKLKEPFVPKVKLPEAERNIQIVNFDPTVNTQEIVDNVNAYLHQMGLPALAIATDPQNANTANGSVAVIGSTAEDAISFIQKLSPSFASDLTENWNGISNPERSAPTGNVISVASDRTINYTQKINEKNNSISSNEMISFFILHGAGHNAGFRSASDGDNHAPSGVMMEGGGIGLYERGLSKYFSTSGNTIEGLINQEVDMSLTVQSNRGVSEVSSTTLKGALINKYGIKNYGDGYKYQKDTF